MTNSNLPPSNDSTILQRFPVAKALELNGKNGEKFKLNHERLMELFASTERSFKDYARSRAAKITQKNYENSPDLATQFIGRFGLKNPNEVVQFLNSRAGETVKTNISGQLIELALIKKELDFQQREKELRKHRLLAFALLYFTMKKDARAQFNERLQQQIDKHLKENKERFEKNSQAAQASDPRLSSIQNQINDLNGALRLNKQEVNAIEQRLEEKLKLFKEKDKEILKSQQDFNVFMDKADERLSDILGGQEANELQNIPLQKKETIINTLENSKNEIDKKIESIMNEITFLSRLSNYFDKDSIKKWNTYDRKTKESELKNLNTQINHLMHLEKSNTANTLSLIERLNKETGLNFYKKILNLNGKEHIKRKIENIIVEKQQASDQLYGQYGEIVKTQDVIRGEEIFCDEYGKEVAKKDARYVLPYSIANEMQNNNKRLEKGSDGKYYLLDKDQELGKLSKEEKDQAHKEAMKIKPQDCLLSREYKENHTKFEQTVNHEAKQDEINWAAIKKSYKLTQQTELLNKLSHAQATLATAKIVLEQNPADLRPIFSSSSKPSGSAASNNSAAQLQSLLDNTESMEANEELLTALKDISQEALLNKALINNELINDIGYERARTKIIANTIKLNSLNPGDRMEPELLKNILKAINIPDNTRNFLQKNINHFAVRTEASTKKMDAPSPFSMRLDPPVR